jgi:uncharacterized protein YbaP (TraB family)
MAASATLKDSFLNTKANCFSSALVFVSLNIISIDNYNTFRMKKTILFLLLLILVIPVSAQKGLLWEISGNGLSKPSYLFGTMHIMCSDDYFEPSGLQRALKGSEALCLEIDVTNPEMGIAMQKALIDPQMRNMKDELDPAAVAGIDSLMRKYMMAGIDKLGILKPWAVATTFSIFTMLDCQSQKQYEIELAMLAKQEEKPIFELENVEFQISMFDSWERADQIQMVNEIVLKAGENRSLFNRMMASYKLQDLDALLQLMNEQTEYIKYNKALLDDRNIDWIPKMAQMMSQRSMFFAVGAGHLGGSNGVISLLKKAGYNVAAVVE